MTLHMPQSLRESTTILSFICVPLCSLVQICKSITAAQLFPKSTVRDSKETSIFPSCQSCLANMVLHPCQFYPNVKWNAALANNEIRTTFKMCDPCQCRVHIYIYKHFLYCDTLSFKIKHDKHILNCKLLDSLFY